MKRSSFSVAWLKEGATTPLIGLCLGFDQSAEHTFGIRDLKDRLGIGEQPTRECLGLRSREMTRLIPSDVAKGDNFLILPTYVTEGLEPWEELHLLEHDLYLAPEERLACAWDDNSFGILVAHDDSEYVGYLHELQEAFFNLNVAVHLAPSNVGGKLAGLIFSIVQNVPGGLQEAMRESDLDWLDLQERAEPDMQKVHDSLGERGKYLGGEVIALVPGWLDEKKTSLMYWFNPTDPSTYQPGWYEPRDVLRWASTGDGPLSLEWQEGGGDPPTPELEVKPEEAKEPEFPVNS